MCRSRRRTSFRLTPLALALVAAPLAACGGIVSPEAGIALRESRSGATLGVYPVLVRQGRQLIEDGDQAERLVERLAGSGFKAVVPASGPAPSIHAAWRMNEARMFRQSADGLAAHLRSNPPAEDYLLHAEYLMSEDGKRVLAAHWLIADRQGRIAAAGMYNSHHEIFRKLDPVDRSGCTRLVAEGVRKEIGAAGAGP